MGQKKDAIQPQENLQTSIDSLFTDESVLNAIRNTDWLTPELVEDIIKHDEFPERKSLSHPYSDEFLKTYLDKGFGDLNRENFTMLSFEIFLTQRLITPDAHVISLGRCEFNTPKTTELAQEIGHDPNYYELDRSMVLNVRPIILVLLAPEDQRRKLIRIICSWGEGYEKRKADVLIWNELIKEGASQFLERQARIAEAFSELD